jgi:hypothetical protein
MCGSSLWLVELKTSPVLGFRDSGCGEILARIIDANLDSPPPISSGCITYRKSVAISDWHWHAVAFDVELENALSLELLG